MRTHSPETYPAGLGHRTTPGGTIHMIVHAVHVVARPEVAAKGVQSWDFRLPNLSTSFYVTSLKLFTSLSYFISSISSSVSQCQSVQPPVHPSMHPRPLHSSIHLPTHPYLLLSVYHSPSLLSRVIEGSECQQLRSEFPVSWNIHGHVNSLMCLLIFKFIWKASITECLKQRGKKIIF